VSTSTYQGIGKQANVEGRVGVSGFANNTQPRDRGESEHHPRLEVTTSSPSRFVFIRALKMARSHSLRKQHGSSETVGARPTNAESRLHAVSQRIDQSLDQSSNTRETEEWIVELTVRFMNEGSCSQGRIEPRQSLERRSHCIRGVPRANHVSSAFSSSETVAGKALESITIRYHASNNSAGARISRSLSPKWTRIGNKHTAEFGRRLVNDIDSQMYTRLGLRLSGFLVRDMSAMRAMLLGQMLEGLKVASVTMDFITYRHSKDAVRAVGASSRQSRSLLLLAYLRYCIPLSNTFRLELLSRAIAIEPERLAFKRSRGTALKSTYKRNKQGVY
jgi:hypothetical protein